MQWILDLFGEGEHLTPLQMSLRIIVMFFLALAMIRIAGRRTFGLNTAFDNVMPLPLVQFWEEA